MWIPKPESHREKHHTLRQHEFPIPNTAISVHELASIQWLLMIGSTVTERLTSQTHSYQSHNRSRCSIVSSIPWNLHSPSLRILLLARLPKVASAFEHILRTNILIFGMHAFTQIHLQKPLFYQQH